MIAMLSLAPKDFELRSLGGGGALELQVCLDGAEPIGTIEELLERKARAQPGERLWISGGGVYVLNGTWVPLVRRDLQSPINAGRLTVSSGRADSTEELVRPQLLIRELFEEIVIYESGQPLLPEVKEYRKVLSVERIVNGACTRANLPWDSPRVLPSTLLRSGSDRLIITRAGKIFHYEDQTLHINYKNGEINLLQAIAVNTVSLSQLSYRDTETVAVAGRNQALNREIYLYNLLTTKILHHNPDGPDKEVFNPPELTAHAEFLLNRLKSRSKPIKNGNHC